MTRVLEKISKIEKESLENWKLKAYMENGDRRVWKKTRSLTGFLRWKKFYEGTVLNEECLVQNLHRLFWMTFPAVLLNFCNACKSLKNAAWAHARLFACVSLRFSSIIIASACNAGRLLLPLFTHRTPFILSILFSRKSFSYFSFHLFTPKERSMTPLLLYSVS